MGTKKLFKIESNFNEGNVSFTKSNYYAYVIAFTVEEALQKTGKEFNGVTVTYLCDESEILK